MELFQRSWRKKICKTVNKQLRGVHSFLSKLGSFVLILHVWFTLGIWNSSKVTILSRFWYEEIFSKDMSRIMLYFLFACYVFVLCIQQSYSDKSCNKKLYACTIYWTNIRIIKWTSKEQMFRIFFISEMITIIIWLYRY